MSKKTPGLGELLRYLADDIDRSSQSHYASIGIKHNPRFTPVLRKLYDAPQTVTELTATLHVTQGAISQTLKLMEAASLIQRAEMKDGRAKKIHLTEAGQALAENLNAQWTLRFAAIAELETEVGFPIRHILKEMIDALKEETFANRLSRLSGG